MVEPILTFVLPISICINQELDLVTHMTLSTHAEIIGCKTNTFDCISWMTRILFSGTNKY